MGRRQDRRWAEIDAAIAATYAQAEQWAAATEALKARSIGGPPPTFELSHDAYDDEDGSW